MDKAINHLLEKRPKCFTFGSGINFNESLINFVNTTPLENAPNK